MTDRELLQMLSDYHYARWSAAASLLDAQHYFEKGDDKLGYDALFAWVEWLEESVYLFGKLFGNEMRAMNILKGRV